MMNHWDKTSQGQIIFKKSIKFSKAMELSI